MFQALAAIAAPLLIGSTGAMVYGMHQQRQAYKAQKESAAAEARARDEQAARQRRQMVREARQQRAQLVTMQYAQNMQGSSGAGAGVADTTQQLGRNMSFLDRYQGQMSQSMSAQQRAAGHSFRAGMAQQVSDRGFKAASMGMKL